MVSCTQYRMECGDYAVSGACRIYVSRFDFCPFFLLLRCQNTHVAQLRSVFVALHQEEIIKNRLEALKSDRLLERLLIVLTSDCRLRGNQVFIMMNLDQDELERSFC